MPRIKKKENNYLKLKKKAKDLGIDLFAVADIGQIRQEINLSKELNSGLGRAICLGTRVSDQILEGISTGPTKLYFHHYRTLNMFLDQAALRLSNVIQDLGYRAIAIPASQILDWAKQSAHLSHKKIGYLAGLGWIGRNNLLVNEKLGSQFRLTTILTNMNLEAEKPIKRDCQSCRLCLTVCPVNAIKDKAKDFDYMACFEQLKEFQRQKLTSQYICGICVKACKGFKSGSRTIKKRNKQLNQQSIS